MRKYLVGALAGVLVAAVAFVVILYFADLEIADKGSPAAGSQGIEMPDVVGLPFVDAKARVAALGLDAKATRDAGGPLIGEAFVTRQVPDAGTIVPSTASVTLYWARQ